jgi:hypothetical protein
MPFEPALVTNRPNAHLTLLQGATSHGASATDSEAYAAEVYEKIVAPYVANGRDPDPLKFQEFYTTDARMINPRFERPLQRVELPGYYAALRSQIRDLQLHLDRWAAAPGLLSSSGPLQAKSPGNPSSSPTPIVLRFVGCWRPKALHISTTWRYVHLQIQVYRDSETCQSEMCRPATLRDLDRCLNIGGTTRPRSG